MTNNYFWLWYQNVTSFNAFAKRNRYQDARPQYLFD